ncbi:hypothetical protein Tco_1285958 [Tanacetum coccineum]
MIIEETPKKSKEQILQEEASLDEAIRLDSLQKEEEAKQIHLDSLLAQELKTNKQDAEQPKKSGKRRKQMARKGLHTDIDKDDYEGSDEVSEQDDSVTGTKILINHVPEAMKTPSIATYKIIKQGEKGVYQIVREDGMIYGMDGLESFNGLLSLIERKYPLSAEICKAMLDKKLQGGKPDEDCYKMLKMMEKQAVPPCLYHHKNWLVQEQGSVKEIGCATSLWLVVRLWKKAILVHEVMAMGEDQGSGRIVGK